MMQNQRSTHVSKHLVCLLPIAVQQINLKFSSLKNFVLSFRRAFESLGIQKCQLLAQHLLEGYCQAVGQGFRTWLRVKNPLQDAHSHSYWQEAAIP